MLTPRRAKITEHLNGSGTFHLESTIHPETPFYKVFMSERDNSYVLQEEWFPGTSKKITNSIGIAHSKEEARAHLYSKIKEIAQRGHEEHEIEDLTPEGLAEKLTNYIIARFPSQNVI